MLVVLFFGELQTWDQPETHLNLSQDLGCFLFKLLGKLVYSIWSMVLEIGQVSDLLNYR